MCVLAKLLQSCLTLCNPMDCSLPGSSVHGILQARILEWVASPSSKGSSWPRDGTHVSYVYLHWQSGSLPPAPLGKLPNPFWLLKRSCNQMHRCSLLYLLLEAQWRVGEGGGQTGPWEAHWGHLESPLRWQWSGCSQLQNRGISQKGLWCSGQRSMVVTETSVPDCDQLHSSKQRLVLISYFYSTLPKPNGLWVTLR